MKQRNITMEENSYAPVLPKDFIAPIGMMEMKITDQYNNDASVACVVQRPGGLDNLNVTEGVMGDDVTTLSATVATSLVCNIDYDHIRQLWGILALYSDSPMRLERELLLTMSPEMIYKYKQARSADSEIFTEIDAEIKANPAWLMQGTINLQLDRTTTTYSTLHIKYLSKIEMNIESNKVRRDRFSWTMIKKHNQTKTEFSVLSGGVAELNCEIYGDPKPSTEWILPDGIKVRAPYSSEDRRIEILDSGKLTLRAADSSDAGIYHCIATNYLDADVLSFRVTVLSPDVEEEDVNGVRLSRTVGGSLVLDCETNGTPEASVQWILPDHTVMDRSFGNRRLYPNGTLAVHPLTERDRGFYRCIAANHLGVDLLASLVTVSTDVSKIVTQTSIDGSGDDVQVGMEDSHMLYSEGDSSRVSQESRTITSDRPYPRLRPSLRHGATTNRRGGSRHTGWSRRVFDKASRRVDPERLADYIKRSQNKKSRKDKDGSINPTDKSQANVGLSVDDETGSGNIVFEDDVSKPDQAISSTENPENIYGGVMTTYHLLKNDQNKAAEITEALRDDLSNVITTTENMSTVTTGSYSYTDGSPMVPSVTLSNYEFQKDETTPLITTQGYKVGLSRRKSYSSERSTNTPLQPFTIKFTVTETMDEMELQFSGDMPETATEVLPHLNSQGPNVTSTLDRSTKRANPVVHMSTDPESQTTFTAVTTTEREQDEITFHTTQRIKSPHLPPGSTIISHQQIHIIPPNKKRPGRRRNFFSRRRIIRPNKITDIQSLLDKIKRPSVEYESNTTVPYAVELTTNCDNAKGRMSTVKSKTEEDSTSRSQLPTSSLEKMEKLSTTTQSTPFISSSVISSKSTTFKSDDQLKSDSSSEYIHKPAKDPVKEVSTNVATTTTKASKVIQGKIPWHRFFGSKEGQREILKRLRKPSKPSIAIKSTTVRTMTTTAPSKALTTLPTAESMAAPMTTMPPVTQRNQGNSWISFDNLSGSSKFTESQNSYEGITLFTTASPSNKYQKAPVMYTPVTIPMYGTRLSITTPSHFIPIPPSLTTTKMTYKEDTVEFSGSDSGGSGGFAGRSGRIRKPGFNRRRGFRGRRPVKISTTQAPTTKSATLETTSLTPQTTSRVTKPLYIPTIEVARSSIHVSSDIIDSDNEEWRNTAKPTNFPKTHSIASEPSPTQSLYYTTNTAMAYITPQSETPNTKGRINTNKIIPPRRGGRYQTQRPAIQRIRPKLTNRNRDHLKLPRATTSPDTKRDGSKKRTSTERTLIYDTVTVVTAEEDNKITSVPSSSEISNEILNTYDTISSTTNGFESSTKDKTSKPRIIGGHAASFTVESNSDAFLPCEATGNPEPAISWKRFSPGTGTHILNFCN